ncbi:hypothetical protein [Kitasatospora sp. NPDC085879]|jgi:hypothetical protein|uniref:hypothetical protein n=1 Tax=Kitasatospora sp. NPDC085879 TaxID=3154769 RepID=UPI003439C5FD
MTCADYRDAISAQLDGETPADPDPDADADIAPHCADCAEWLAAARRLQALTRAAPGPSPDWTERLLGSLGLRGGGAPRSGDGTDTDK